MALFIEAFEDSGDTGLETRKMWYVIQTLGGKEEETADMIRKMVSSYYMEECFVPKRERMKKFHGSWNKVEEVLFYGYVFVISEKPNGLYQELNQIPRLTKVLGREEGYFFSLNKEDEELVRRVGDQKHKTSMSKIVVEEGKKIQIIEGPLKYYIGNIAKVNLHKREVAVRLGFMGKEMELYMGIEMADMRKRRKEQDV